MLGKLLKYELKATGRTFLPLYGTVLALALINKLLYAILWKMEWRGFPLTLTAGLASMLYGLVICAIFVMTLIVTIQRFHKSLLGDEGYLMFTLPVKPWQHILSKLIAAAVWFVVSVFVTALSGLLIGLSWDLITQFPRDLVDFIRMLSEASGAHWLLYLLEFTMIGLAALASGILMLYTSMALGHLLPSHRTLGAFGAFLAVNFITQLFTGIAGSCLFRFMDSPSVYSFFRLHEFAGMHIFTLLTLAWFLLFCAAYFLGTNFILKKRLNLE